MARATAQAPAAPAKGNADFIGDALLALKQVDLRTIKSVETKTQVKDARSLLDSARKGLK